MQQQLYGVSGQLEMSINQYSVSEMDSNSTPDWGTELEYSTYSKTTWFILYAVLGCTNTV